MVLGRAAPLPGEYGFLELSEHGLLRELPADHRERVLVAVDCAQETRLTDPALLEAPIVRQHRPPPRQHAVRHVDLVDADASSTGEVLADVFRGAGGPADAGDRRGALHRARHRHRPLPVREHDAEGAAARRRPGRGGRRRAQGLPGRVRDGAVREAEAAGPRARAGTGLRGRAGRRLVPAPDRLPRGRRRRAVLGGDHRPPPGGRGRGARGADPGAARGTAARRARCRCARRWTSSTCRRSHASVGAAATGRPRASPATISIEQICGLHRPRVRGSGRRTRRRRVRAASRGDPEGPRADRDDPRRQARRARRRSRSSRRCEVAPAPDGPRRHARPVRDGPPRPAVRDGRQGSHDASSGWTSAT